VLELGAIPATAKDDDKINTNETKKANVFITFFPKNQLQLTNTSCDDADYLVDIILEAIQIFTKIRSLQALSSIDKRLIIFPKAWRPLYLVIIVAKCLDNRHRYCRHLPPISRTQLSFKHATRLKLSILQSLAD